MRKKIIGITAAAAIAAGGAVFATGIAGAVGGPVTQPKAADAFYACINAKNQVSNAYPVGGWHGTQCPSGTTMYEFPSTQGVQKSLTQLQTALDAANAAQQDQIDALQAGKQPIVTATGNTSVTNWPETSGWANDSFNRTVTIQRHAAADAGKCGPTAKTCWFYTGTISDNGTFTTVDHAQTPNGGDGTATISGVLHGSMVGGTGVEFYASSGAPDGSLAPATQNGHETVGTSDWAKQLFPTGTAFGSFTLPSYSWTYTTTSPDTCEAWVDSINPGDDGASAADGNITGVNHCSA